MPTYEFECSECGEYTSALLAVGKRIKKCPSCGKLKLKFVFSSPSVHDTYSPMHPRRGRGAGGWGRINPGTGSDFGENLG